MNAARQQAIERRQRAAGDPGTWFRIDKQDGFITIVDGEQVRSAAAGNFKKPNHAIATCRFATPFAIYCTGDKLTDEECREL